MATQPAALITCTQCGGELHPDEGQIFLTCPFCSATVYLDKARVVFHWFVAPTLDEAQARAALFRWMSGSQTVKDLDKKASLAGQTFQYFPLWHFVSKNNSGDQGALLPAAATSVTELARLNLPAGDLRRYESGLDAQAVPPSVPLETAQDWHRQGRPQVEVEETALVHVPIYLFKYAFKSQTYTAVVDGASGQVLANLYPAKSELPYRMVGGVAAAVYLGLALIPVLGAFTASDAGALGGVGICAGLGLLAAPILMAWALWVAARV